MVGNIFIVMPFKLNRDLNLVCNFLTNYIKIESMNYGVFNLVGVSSEEAKWLISILNVCDLNPSYISALNVFIITWLNKHVDLHKALNKF